MNARRWGLGGICTVLLGAWLAGCGIVAAEGTNDAGDDAGDGSTDDARARADAAAPPDAPRDAAADTLHADTSACVPSPTRGAACAKGQVPCDKVDVCCAETLSCDAISGTWVSVDVDCACRGFPCGDKTCPGTQYCRARSPGVRFPDGAVPPTVYSCEDFPKPCERQWTCECLDSVPDPSCLKNPPSPSSCRVENGRPLESCMGI